MVAERAERILTRSRCDEACCNSNNNNNSQIRKRPRGRRRRMQDQEQNLKTNSQATATNGLVIETRSVKRQQKPNLLSLPQEIHLMILGYLGARDLNTMRQVSVHFRDIACDPTLWKDYEIFDDNTSTPSVINDLKRMPFLKKINIRNRMDCDEILRQISISNKNIEQISIINCTGSSSGSLYLRAGYLTRIAKRCRRLHTLQFHGTRFRGLKLFRMMGEAGSRLRSLQATTTRDQFRTFVRHAAYVTEFDRKLLALLPRKNLTDMQYKLVCETPGQPAKIFVTYRECNGDLIYLEFTPNCGDIDKNMVLDTTKL